eukprot:3239626-Karenia_brevis.AAC.1
MPNGFTACQMWAAESHLSGRGFSEAVDGDGSASMHTHSTEKSAGHDGDGSASMRTYSTPAKAAGHVGDGL